MNKVQTSKNNKTIIESFNQEVNPPKTRIENSSPDEVKTITEKFIRNLPEGQTLINITELEYKDPYSLRLKLEHIITSIENTYHNCYYHKYKISTEALLLTKTRIDFIQEESLNKKEYERFIKILFFAVHSEKNPYNYARMNNYLPAYHVQSDKTTRNLLFNSTMTESMNKLREKEVERLNEDPEYEAEILREYNQLVNQLIQT